MSVLFDVAVWSGLALPTIGATAVANNSGVRNDR
jgi:hypothetical protein